MFDFLRPFTKLPPYGLGALVVLLVYAVQSEVRFGREARKMQPGSADRGSTFVVSLSSAIPIFGFAAAMSTRISGRVLPGGLGDLPGMPAIAWIGVVLGALGLFVRLWSVMTLRERYTRTLLTGGADHELERSGPYRFVRHPGYLGSLLCLNGIALASGNVLTALASLAATSAAYAYRIHVEDTMLITRFGASYESYCREVPALIPWRRGARASAS